MTRKVIVEGDRDGEALATPSLASRRKELRSADRAVRGDKMPHLAGEERRAHRWNKFAPRVARGVAHAVVDESDREAAVGETRDTTDDVGERQAESA
jgi:DNA polymerase elongation subunit (family B)